MKNRILQQHAEFAPPTGETYPQLNGPVAMQKTPQWPNDYLCVYIIKEQL